MFELCDRLTGIYKTFNCTKSITIDPRLGANDGSKETVTPASQSGDLNGAVDTSSNSCSENELDENDEVIEDSMNIDDGEAMEIEP